MNRKNQVAVFDETGSYWREVKRSRGDLLSAFASRTNTLQTKLERLKTAGYQRLHLSNATCNGQDVHY